MTDPIPHYSPEGPQGPPELPNWPGSEPVVIGNPTQCHFCGQDLPIGDQFDFHIKQQDCLEGQDFETYRDWWAAGEVVPVCEPCRDSINAREEIVDEQTGETRMARRLRLFLDMLLWPTVVIVIAMLVAYGLRALRVL